MDRRSLLAAFAASSVAGAQTTPPKPKQGRLKQSVCRSVFPQSMGLDEQCRLAASLGVLGYDLIPPERWPIVKKHGLTPALATGTGMTLSEGIVDAANHDRFEKSTRPLIGQAAAAGVPNIIVLSGNRTASISDARGLDNAVAWFNRVKAEAEDKQVTLCLELLNSKVDHPGYMADHTAWGVEMCKRVNSPRVKLLYDIYHMQIMEGDVIRTIRDNIAWIGHFHTAGNPGRHEPDGTQELSYIPIAKAIAELGFTGFVAHEYSPVRDAVTSLRETVALFAGA